jgi:Flp pilus assembly CpaE family ATPase
MIVLVVQPNIPSIKSARLFLEVARKLNYPTEEIALVINCVDRRGGIPADKIEQALVPVVARIPFDEQAALDAANRGAPFVVRDQGRPISQAILMLARHIKQVLVGAEEPEGAEEEESRDMMLPGTGRLRLGRLFQ